MLCLDTLFRHIALFLVSANATLHARWFTAPAIAEFLKCSLVVAELLLANPRTTCMLVSLTAQSLFQHSCKGCQPIPHLPCKHFALSCLDLSAPPGHGQCCSALYTLHKHTIIIRHTPVKEILQSCTGISLMHTTGIPMLTWLIESSDFHLSTGAEARWADVTVQQCLDLCSNVDLVYKLLIQEIQPVLGKQLLPGSYHRSSTVHKILFRRSLVSSARVSQC